MTFELHITLSQFDLPAANDRVELLNRFQTTYFRIHQWSFTTIHSPSTGTIELFSIPVRTKHLSLDLYRTEIDTTTTTDGNLFENIEHISLHLTNSSEATNLIRSPNAQTLRLISHYHEHELYPKQLLVNISRAVNLSKLTSIELDGQHFPISSLVLLDYTPNLHSLTLAFQNLIKMTRSLTDQTLCRRLSTLIKHLTIK